MTPPLSSPSFRLSRFLLAVLCLAGLTGWVASAQDTKQPEFKAPELKPLTEQLPAAFKKGTPESVDDLKAIQEHVDKVVEKIMPAVVSVRIGPAFGSGVIVSKDGYVLTAGHVSGKADRDVTVYFHNGKTAKGKTLGGNHGIDSGMIKITTEGNWPTAEMGDSSDMKTGTWCLVCAHPGGYKSGRTPPVRLGRVLNANASTITTDCVLVGGDSGGPLFDMHGRVVGINSRIGQSVLANMHVPVNPFRDGWEKHAKGEVWGGKLGAPAPAKAGPFLGVRTDPKAEGAVVVQVVPGSPAEKAGVKVDDLILKFDGKEVSAAAILSKFVLAKKVGDVVPLEIRRGEEKLTLKIELGKR
jgi:serine protease Do